MYFNIDSIIDQKKLDSYIAIIYSNSKKGLRTTKQLYVRASKTKEYNSLETIVLRGNQQFLMLPKLNDLRSILYASGQSGSGKSYLANQYASLYHLLYPTRNILYFTCNSMNDDPSLDLKLYTEIDMPKFIKSLRDEKPDDTLFKDSLLIVDDINGLEKEDRKLFWGFLDKSMECMRRKNVSLYVINHISTNYRETAMLILECNYYIIYCNNLKARTDRVLTSYYKLPTNVINKLMSQDSRWVAIDSNRSIIITENKIYNIFEDDEKNK